MRNEGPFGLAQFVQSHFLAKTMLHEHGIEQELDFTNSFVITAGVSSTEAKLLLSLSTCTDDRPSITCTIYFPISFINFNLDS